MAARLEEALAKATGAATVILSGISLGLESAVYTAVIIGGAVYLAFLLGGGNHHVSGSLGIALYPDDGRDARRDDAYLHLRRHRDRRAAVPPAGLT